jgi:hypothetical protein
MMNFIAKCIEQDDSRQYVLHEVEAEEDGVTYVLKVVAECPITAIDVAKYVKQDEGWRVKG